MADIKSIRSLNLAEPPSCIAFCPSRPNYFVVGTYLLHQNAQSEGAHLGSDGDSTQGSTIDDVNNGQKRTGSLSLYELDGDRV